jgi:hypothetical protein
MLLVYLFLFQPSMYLILNHFAYVKKTLIIKKPKIIILYNIFNL